MSELFLSRREAVAALSASAALPFLSVGLSPAFAQTTSADAQASALLDSIAENLLRQSGRGLLLIKAFVDEFTMRKAPPMGTEIRLVVSKNKQEA